MDLKSKSEVINGHKSELESLKSLVSESDSKLQEAVSQRLELEAQVGSSNDERKSLLERCLGAEGELDRTRSNVNELRRKLDQSQAALHELGRENQSIQVSIFKAQSCSLF